MMNIKDKKDLRFKHGDAREDGHRFWSYHPRCLNGEWWVSPEKWAELKEKFLKRRRLTHEPQKSKRETVPKPKHGDIRKDGFRFHGYDKRANREVWYSPEAWARVNPNWKPARGPEICRHERYLKQTLRNTRVRAAAKGWEFDLDFEFLAGSFPKDGRCPLSKEAMVWGLEDGIHNSPSLDRIDWSKGYVKGNVWFISHRENRRKAVFERDLPAWVKVFADDCDNVTFDPRPPRGL